MSENSPDRWVLLQIDDIQKVLAGWSGGYLDADSWKLSSGVIGITETDDYYLFKNHSGSVYKCHKTGEGYTVLSSAKYREIELLCKENNVRCSVVTMGEEK